MDRRLLWLAGLTAPVFIWSVIAPHDLFTWFLEVVPVLIGLPLLLALQRRFRFSTLLLVLLGLHGVILMVGGHYTYARVPLGDWAMEWFGWPRNNYDKLGHFAQGFVPAILMRELLLRTSPLKFQLHGPFDSAQGIGSVRPSRWLGILVVSVCLAFSALYELIEWLTAVMSGAAAEDFLGTQGYAWDTQTDMALALVGAVLALLLLAKAHDRSLAKVAG